MPSDNDLYKMSDEQLGRLFPINICEPSEKWADIYQAERKKIFDSISESEIIRINHIGSTAIPNLKAKPTIDILVQVSENTDSDKIIQ